MRTFRLTNRTNYTYKTATGETYTITPDDVGAAWIAHLYAEDDAADNADRRENYHAPIHYDSQMDTDGEGAYANDKIAYLEDPAPDPLEALLEIFEEEEYENRIDSLKAAIQTLQPQQIDLIYKIFYEKRTRVEIAEAEGVTEAAIRNRLQKIYKALRNRVTA